MDKVNQIQSDIDTLDRETIEHSKILQSSLDRIKTMVKQKERLETSKTKNLIQNQSVREKIFELDCQLLDINQNIRQLQEYDRWIKEIKRKKLVGDLCVAKLMDRDRIYKSMIENNESVDSMIQVLLINPQQDDRYKKYLPARRMKNAWKLKFSDNFTMVHYPCWMDSHEGLIQHVEKSTGNVYDQNKHLLFNMRNVIPSQLKFDSTVGWVVD